MQPGELSPTETKAYDKSSHSFRAAQRGESDLSTGSENSTQWEVTDWLIPVVFPLPVGMKSVARNHRVVSLTTRRKCTTAKHMTFSGAFLTPLKQ